MKTWLFLLIYALIGFAFFIIIAHYSLSLDEAITSNVIDYEEYNKEVFIYFFLLLLPFWCFWVYSVISHAMRIEKWE